MHGEVIVLGGVFDHLHERLVGGGSEIGGGSVRPVGRLQKALHDRLEEGRKRRRRRVPTVLAQRLVIRSLRQAERRNSFIDSIHSFIDSGGVTRHNLTPFLAG